MISILLFVGRLIDKYNVLFYVGATDILPEPLSKEKEDYYIDLVFYNYILKCFILVELKTGPITHQDIGQIDFYVRYFDNEIKTQEDAKLILEQVFNNQKIEICLLEDFTKSA